MTNKDPGQSSRMISILQKSKEIKNEKEKEEKKGEKLEMKLPEKKGLRTTILKLILENLESQELMKMGLVNKEFYDVSRDNWIWKRRIEKEFPFIISKNENDIPLKKKYGRFIFYYYSPNDDIDIKFNRNVHVKIDVLASLLPEIDKILFFQSPLCQYWAIRDEILRKKSGRDFPIKRSKFDFFFFFSPF